MSLLEISIPTRNRASYLRELLKSLCPEMAYYREFISINIFDNCSTDGTPDAVKAVSIPCKVKYRLNDRNLTGDENIYQAYTVPEGKYIWVIGDDELIPEGALGYIVDTLIQANPSLMILKDLQYKMWFSPSPFYETYKVFAKIADNYNPHSLIAHSLISANIVKRECFDDRLAKELISTNYGHFYGIVNGVMNKPVAFSKNHTLFVRPNRASPVDGIWPGDIEQKQIEYLRWLRNVAGLKYNPETVLQNYRLK